MIIIVKDLRVLEECSKLAAGWTAAVGKDGREGEGRGTTGGEGNDWRGGERLEGRGGRSQACAG